MINRIIHTVLRILAEMSVNTPIVWNSNMYHSDAAAKLLCGVVDVYLGDFKYGNDGYAKRCRRSCITKRTDHPVESAHDPVHGARVAILKLA